MAIKKIATKSSRAPKRETLVEGLRQAVHAYLAQDLPKAVRTRNPQPVFKAHYWNTIEDADFHCFLCGSRCEVLPGSRLYYSAYVQRDHSSELGRLCRICREGGPLQALATFREQIVDRSIPGTHGFHHRGWPYWVLEDQIVFFKLMRACLRHAATWWPKGGVLQRLNEHANREDLQQRKEG